MLEIYKKDNEDRKISTSFLNSIMLKTEKISKY